MDKEIRKLDFEKVHGRFAPNDRRTSEIADEVKEFRGLYEFLVWNYISGSEKNFWNRFLGTRPQKLLCVLVDLFQVYRQVVRIL